MENVKKRIKSPARNWFGTNGTVLPLDVQFLVLDCIFVGEHLRKMASICHNWKECVDLYMYHTRPLMFHAGSKKAPFFVTSARGFIIAPVPNNTVSRNDYRAPIICSKNAFLVLRILRPTHVLVGQQWRRYNRYGLCKFTDFTTGPSWCVHTQTKRGLWDMFTFPVRPVSRTALGIIRNKMKGNAQGLARFCTHCGHIFNPSYKGQCTQCGRERTPAAIAYKSWQEF